jgi:HPt (histidine-containing phosphotransfer) domain-containing protein
MVKIKQMDEYEIHFPPERLKEIVKSSGGLPFDEVEKRAAEKLEALTDTFLANISEGISVISEAVKQFESGAGSTEDRDKICKEGHALMGTAATFSFPLLGTICQGLCDLTDEDVPPEDIKTNLIRVHLDMLVWAVTQRIKDEEDPRAATLLGALKQAQQKS